MVFRFDVDTGPFPYGPSCLHPTARFLDLCKDSLETESAFTTWSRSDSDVHGLLCGAELLTQLDYGWGQRNWSSGGVHVCFALRALSPALWRTDFGGAPRLSQTTFVMDNLF